MTGLASALLTLDTSDGKAPTEVVLFRRGPNPTSKGVVTVDDESGRAVLAAFAAQGVELPIDYDHAMARDDVDPRARVAAGWWRPAVREDGSIVATDIRWTPAALAAIEAREWRYISPWLLHDKAMNLRAIRNFALTNRPATVDAIPLVANQDDDSATSAAGEDDTMELQALSAALLSATGAADHEAALARIASLTERANRCDAAEAQVKQLTADVRRGKVDGLIAAALADGRIKPAKKGEFEKLGEVSLEALELSLSAIEAPKAVRMTPAETDLDSKILTAEEKAIAEKYGYSDAVMIAARKG